MVFALNTSAKVKSSGSNLGTGMMFLLELTACAIIGASSASGYPSSTFDANGIPAEVRLASLSKDKVGGTLTEKAIYSQSAHKAQITQRPTSI